MEYNLYSIFSLIMFIFLLIVSLRSFYLMKKNLKKNNLQINEIILKNDYACYEIHNLIANKINQYFSKKSEEHELKLKELKNEYQENKKKLEENYYSCEIKLPNEIISMYEKLDEEEKDLFVTLARNAESEKDFSNIYVQCISVKNNREVFKEQRRQTYEIKKQAMLTEEEHKKQTRILKEQAEREKIHMKNIEQQNKELLKKQIEANRLAERNVRK